MKPRFGQVKMRKSLRKKTFKRQSISKIQLLILYLILESDVLASNSNPIRSNRIETYCKNNKDNSCKPICPKDCYCQDNGKLLHVKCNNDRLSQITPKSNIGGLDLSHNSFTEIPNNIIQFPHLKRLILANNRIADVNVTIFKFTPELKELDLSANDLTWDTAHIHELLKITNLEQLILSSNDMSDFFLEINENFASNTLEILDLSYCNINAMEDYTNLNRMKVLNTLNLTGNRIKWFNEIASNSIEVLDLTQCRLTHIRTRAFKRMPMLKLLILDNNPKLRMYPSIEPLSNSIVTLSAQHCNLSVNFLPNFPQLKILNLNANFIRYLQRTTFSYNHEIKIINLASSGIVNFDSNVFTHVTYLHSVDLSDNSIKALPADLFVSNKYLEILNLAKNNFKQFPDIESNSLLSLDLSSCYIKTIHSTSLIKMPKLQRLDLSYNPIQTLPNDWKTDSVVSLDLSYCFLTEINDNNFVLMTNLHELRLKGNNLSKALLPSYFPTRLSRINLMKNPWQCECSSEIFYNFYNYLVNTSERRAVDSELTCHTPESMSDETWLTACHKHWYNRSVPSHRYKDRYIWFVLLSILSMGGAFYVTYLFCRHYFQVPTERQCELETDERASIQDARVRLVQIGQSLLSENPLLNAPDPRDIVDLPSYDEAIVMLREFENVSPKLTTCGHVQSDPFELNDSNDPTDPNDPNDPNNSTPTNDDAPINDSPPTNDSINDDDDRNSNCSGKEAHDMAAKFYPYYLGEASNSNELIIYEPDEPKSTRSANPTNSNNSTNTTNLNNSANSTNSNNSATSTNLNNSADPTNLNNSANSTNSNNSATSTNLNNSANTTNLNNSANSINSNNSATSTNLNNSANTTNLNNSANSTNSNNSATSTNLNNSANTTNMNNSANSTNSERVSVVNETAL